MKKHTIQTTKHRVAGVLALFATASFLAVGPAEARKPVTGVSCEGGFFVRMHDSRVFWIHGEPERKELVYSGGSTLVAMAMCDAGVLAVFEDKETPNMSRVIYSPDCRNIGESEGQSISVAARPAQIKKIAHAPDAVTLYFADGQPVTNASCTRHKWD